MKKNIHYIGLSEKVEQLHRREYHQADSQPFEDPQPLPLLESIKTYFGGSQPKFVPRYITSLGVLKEWTGEEYEEV